MSKKPRPFQWLRRRKRSARRRRRFVPRVACSTGDVLAALAEEGWEVHERDRLARGPGGVFLLETKRLEGLVAVEDGVLVTRSPDDGLVTWRDARLPRWLRAQAGSASVRLARVGGARRWVQPVVVIWGHFEQRRVETGGVVYVHGRELAAWLRSRPAASS